MWTVFFNIGCSEKETDAANMPQDFKSIKEAEEYAEERVSKGIAKNYVLVEA